MFPYIVVLVPICLTLLILRIGHPRMQKAAAYICLLGITLFAGLRGYVGIDTYTYHAIFRNAQAETLWSVLSRVEPLFALLIKCSGFLSSNSFLFIALISLFQGFVLLKLIKGSRAPADFMAVYISSFFLAFEFNILRSGTSILFLILASRRMEDRNRRSFYLYGFLAVLCHYSAIVAFLPMLFMKVEGLKAKLKLILVLVSVMAGAFVFIVSNDAQFQKYVFYFVDLRTNVPPSYVALLFRVMIYFTLFICIVNKMNYLMTSSLFLIWLLLRLAMINFVFIDRIEIMVSAILLFAALELRLSGWRLRLRAVSVVLLVLGGLYSTIKGLGIREEELTRGVITLDEDHSMSPYVPYKFFWEESKR